jgi:hypothetical protein
MLRRAAKRKTEKNTEEQCKVPCGTWVIKTRRMEDIRNVYEIFWRILKRLRFSGDLGIDGSPVLNGHYKNERLDSELDSSD